MNFLNPLLLGGLAIAAAPIIIHLLNKRRFVIHDWAAMDFLLQASITNRRRLRFEDFLLLLMRVLLVALLVFTVARPLLQGLGDWNEDRRVVIVDDSFSMALSTPTATVFELARESAANQVQDAIGRKVPVDIQLGSRPEGLGVERIEAPLVGEDADDPATREEFSKRGWELAQSMRQIEISDRPLQLARILERVVEEVDADPSLQKRSVVLVSDFRRVDWLEEESDDLQTSVASALGKIDEKGLTGRFGFLFVDVGRDVLENVAVSDVRVAGRHVLAGVPTRIVVEVTNFSKKPRSQVEGSVEIRPAGAADSRRTHRLALPRIVGLEPGASSAVEVEFTFAKAGSYLLRATLEKDALARDNENYAVVSVRESIRALIVDGDPGPERFSGESDYLLAALSPSGLRASGIEPRRTTETITADAIADVDVVLLLNRAGLEPAERDILARFLERGGGLAYFLGNRVRAEDYRDLTRAVSTARTSDDGDGDDGSDGDGGSTRSDEPMRPVVLFPATLGAEVAPDERLALVPTDLGHPTFELFEGMEGSPLEDRLFGRHLAVQPLEGATVAARFSDEEKTPMIVELASGTGRVALFNTSADRDWTDWPTHPSWLLVMQEWVRYLAPRRDQGQNLEVGDELRWKVTPGHRYTVFRPSGLGERVERDERDGEDEPVDRTRLAYAKTYEAGFYRVEGAPAFDPPAPGESAGAVFWYAVRRPLEESDLEPLGETRLRALLDPLGIKYAVGKNLEVDAFEKEQEGEIWRWLALGAGLLLLLELFAAWWFGRRA